MCTDLPCAFRLNTCFLCAIYNSNSKVTVCMRPEQQWTGFFPAVPMGRCVYGMVWAIQSCPSMPRQMKAYTGQLVLSKLRLPDSVRDLILEYGCKANDYLLVLSTPSHITCEVWALWADIPDIRWGLRVRAYMRRFLGLWNYKCLLPLLCVNGPETRLSWIEAEVNSDDDMVVVGRVRYRKNRLVYAILPGRELRAFRVLLGKWVFDGENLGIPLYKALFLQ